MNRIHLSHSVGSETGTVGSTTQHAGDSAPTSQLVHCLFTPLHYEPNYRYPLIVWLHSPKANELELRKVMPGISMRNHVAVAPRGTVSAGAGDDGFTWDARPAELQLAEQHIFDAIACAQRQFNVGEDRVFLAGFDRGGTIALRVGLKHPDRFAGIVSLGGAFPKGGTPLVELDRARKLPVFLGCGRESQAYPTSNVCDNLRLMHSAGIHVTLRQYPCGQMLDPTMLADVDRWIIERITSG